MVTGNFGFKETLLVLECDPTEPVKTHSRMITICSHIYSKKEETFITSKTDILCSKTLSKRFSTAKITLGQKKTRKKVTLVDQRGKRLFSPLFSIQDQYTRL